MTERQPAWTESDSETFLDLADVAVPARREQMEVLLSLIPARPADAFLAVDLGCGEGLLGAQILERYPNARLIGFDGSELMRDKARARLSAYGQRAEVHYFDLLDKSWPAALRAPLRCVISSLALHHIDDGGKRYLFRQLAPMLEPGGALLIADIIAPASEVVRRSFAAAWDRIARQQSLALRGALDAYQKAVADGWNSHVLTEAVPGETPSRLFHQLKWLEEAGLSAVDCFWMRSGIAVYGGYR